MDCEWIVFCLAAKNMYFKKEFKILLRLFQFFFYCFLSVFQDSKKNKDETNQSSDFFLRFYVLFATKQGGVIKNGNAPFVSCL